MKKKLFGIIFLFFFSIANLYSQSETKITGKITGNNGVPLIGVTIQEVGTENQTLSDKNGAFGITVTKSAATLLLSYVGYENRLYKLNNKSTVAIELTQKAGDLDQVVVVGYGAVKKKDITGSVSSVKGSDLKELPSQRVDQALQGRAAGVLVQNTDGAPGGKTNIVIRGSNSINGGNQALVVIDGLQGGNISNLNPNDVESVEILKDASATAIYGSRGANGVILVTTKKGIKGKPSISYTFNYTNQKLGKRLDLMNPYEFATTVNASNLSRTGFDVNNPITPALSFTPGQLEDFKSNPVGTDWQGIIYRTAVAQNHQLSISGGNDDTKYYFSGGMINQDGILKTANFKRLTIQGNLETKINSWLKAGVNLSMVRSNGTVPPFEARDSRRTLILTSSILVAPQWASTIPVYNADGSYTKHPGSPASYTGYSTHNPLATLLETTPKRSNFTNGLYTYVEAGITKDLKFRVSVGGYSVTDENSIFRNQYTQEGTLNTAGLGGQAFLANYKYEQLQNSNQLTYTKDIKKHHFDITAVQEQQIERQKYSTTDASLFSNLLLGFNGIGSASTRIIGNPTETERVLRSFLGRVNYSFAGKYLLTASYRADGSSVFGKNNKWAYFPSMALAWRLSEEKFIKDLKIFSDFKLRTSIGKTGNQGISPYGSLAQIISIGGVYGYDYPYGGGGTIQGLGLYKPANPNLKWETTEQKNIGIDVGFFNGRLKLTADYYTKITTDLLLNRKLAGYSGFANTEYIDNVGSLSNKGTELSISGDPVVGKVKWNSSFNISWNKSKVLDIGETDFIQFESSQGAYGVRTLFLLRKNSPFGEFNGYKIQGLWKESERKEAAIYGQIPGMQHYVDINNDGLIDNKDETVIGQALPKYIFGWSNRVSYKIVDISFLVQGVQGNNIFNQQRINLEQYQGGTSRRLLDRWTPDNQNTDIPEFFDEVKFSGLALQRKINIDPLIINQTSRYVEDGSYIRLKNITLGVNVPNSVINKLKIQKIRIYASASNVFTITKYKGYDPEVSSFNDANAQVGVDLGNFPSSKTFTFGIDVSF